MPMLTHALEDRTANRRRLSRSSQKEQLSGQSRWQGAGSRGPLVLDHTGRVDLAGSALAAVPGEAKIVVAALANRMAGQRGSWPRRFGV